MNPQDEASRRGCRAARSRHRLAADRLRRLQHHQAVVLAQRRRRGRRRRHTIAPAAGRTGPGARSAPQGEVVAAANDVLRFVLELAGIVSAAYWGYHASSSWAFVVAPGASNPIQPTVRMLIGSVLLLLTAAGLYVAGQRTPAIAFAVLIVVNTLIALVAGG
jgi:hypothetical protein